MNAAETAHKGIWDMNGNSITFSSDIEMTMPEKLLQWTQKQREKGVVSIQKRTYSTRIADAISEFLGEVGLKFSFDDRHGQFGFSLRLKGKVSKVTYAINVGENEYTVYAVSSVYPNQNNRKMMYNLMEFLCRANYGMAGGNFELNMDNGEIRMKYFVDCDGTAPTIELVKRSICSPGLMFERYGDGIADIILDNATAKEAAVWCERPPIEEDSTTFEGQDDENDSEEVERIFARLEKRLGHSRDEASAEAAWDAGIPRHIKIDLFGTEGGAD